MTSNEGSIDRFVRIVLGCALIALVFLGPKTWFGLVGVVLVATGVIGFCPLYRAIGLSTRAKHGDSASHAT